MMMMMMMLTMTRGEFISLRYKWILVDGMVLGFLLISYTKVNVYEALMIIS